LALAFIELIAVVVHEIAHCPLGELGLFVDQQASVSDYGADSHRKSVAPA
jgi:hypothetical protein